MKNVALIMLAMLTLAIAGAMAMVPADGRDADEKAVKEAVTEFYAGVNAMFTGDLEPIRKLWSHADDVTYMGPEGGYQVGWAAVLAAWEDQAEMNLSGKVGPERVHVTLGRDLAIVHNLERGENVKDGKREVVSIRATNLFRREEGKWKMIGHHADLLPYLKK